MSTVDFLVVKVPLAYNMILGYPSMKMAKVVLSIYHLMMKFLTELGIEEVRRNQLMAREYYFVVTKRKQKEK